VSAAEWLIGIAIVLGHNVWRVIPNEVFILTALGIVSMRLRNGSVAALGFRRAASWRNLFLLALAAAALRLALGELVIDPVTARFWPPAVLPEGADEIAGDIRTALLYLLIVLSFAAFGEEISYRGYLLNRGAEALGGSGAAYWIAAVISAVAFGFGHFYKGPPGIIDSGVAGMILASAYLLAGRNLWVCVLAHGFIDTFGIIQLYFGWDG
jgi:membrane protease YdiL (CAAX protease family)